MNAIPLRLLPLPQDHWEALVTMAEQADVSPEQMLKMAVREAQALRRPAALRPMRRPTENGPKQMLVLRKDLNMRKGKMVTQGAHASLAVLLDSALHDEVLRTVTFKLDEAGWRWLVEDRFKKICVGVNSEAELFELQRLAKLEAIPHALILDAGLTEFGRPTYTALALGPADPQQLGPLTGHLTLL